MHDLDRISSYVGAHANSARAKRWFDEIFKAIRTLAQEPRRCPLAEESADLGGGVRRLLHGRRNRRYKIYFAIHEDTKTVQVFHVRHWALKPLEGDELQDRSSVSPKPSP